MECKKLLKSKKIIDKKLPLMAQPFLLLYILIQQFRITIDSVHRSHWRRAKKSETKKRTFSETDLYFFLPDSRRCSLYWALLQLKMLCCRDFWDKFCSGISEPFDWQKLFPLSSQHQTQSPHPDVFLTLIGPSMGKRRWVDFLAKN